MRNKAEVFDFIVVGSGGGGMTAALVAADQGARVLVLEKSDVYGGSTAISGGVIWVPDNHLMKAAGLDDSPQDAMRYLEQVVSADTDRPRLQAYLEQAPAMLRYLEQHADVRFEAATQYMDYYPELEGGKSGGRSLDPLPCSRRRLGVMANQQRVPVVGGMRLGFSVTAREAHTLLNFNWKSWLFVARRLLHYYADIPSRLRGLPDNRLTLGQALVARLRLALAARNIPLWLSTPVQELLVEKGRVSGVVVERDGERVAIGARKAVLLAAGDFAHNGAMRERYHGLPGAQWTAASPDNTGDAIVMGQAVGGAVKHMDCAWWTPTLLMPDGTVMALINGKSMPGSIFVNRAGQRFVNEAAPYEDVVKAQLACHRNGASAIPCYMIFDRRFRHNYAVGTLAPAKVIPDRRLSADMTESGFLTRADSLQTLAEKLDIDAEGLQETVNRVNVMAESGIDQDFGRGDSLHDRYYCDPACKPNPTFGALQEAPFYALKIFPGDLGTKGGLLCDHYARVLTDEGAVVEGLYATGNCAAAVVGDSYPGAGATIGSSMTFAYVAARHACQ